MGRLCLAALAAAVLASPVLAQETPTFRVDVRLVRLLATVKDMNGKPVGGLTQADMTVLDNGVPQEIALFERHTAQPLSIALLVDTSGSTAKELKYEGDSVSRFLKALFREGNEEDRLSLFSFNWEVQQQTGFIRSLDRLNVAMRSWKAEAGTSMYDAIWLATEQLDEREGRKVMILVTDGGDTVSQKTFQDALKALHRTDTVLYSILVMPITNDAGRNIGGENALQTMSAGTGGRVFYPSIGATLDEAFDEILRDLRTQYLIGFYPKNVPLTKDPFHRLAVKLSRPGLQVVTRTGYYGEVVEDSVPARESTRPRSKR